MPSVVTCCKNPRPRWVKRDRSKTMYRAHGGTWMDAGGFRRFVREALAKGERFVGAAQRSLGPIVHAYVCMSCGKADR